MNKKALSKLVASSLAAFMLTFSAISGGGIKTLGATVVTAKEPINLRTQASWSSSKIDVVYTGEKATLLGYYGDWIKVTFEGKTGYLPKGYVTYTTVTTPAPAPAPVSKGSSYTLLNSVSVYGDAASAYSKTRSVGTYSAGNYYIYKIYNGMYNISKQSGVPGAWINPSTNVGTVTKPVTSATNTTVATKETTSATSTTKATSPAVTTAGPVVSNGTMTIYSSYKTYVTAYNAKIGSNSIGSFPAGTYYVYKIYNGMYNITRTKGVPGAWINPGSVSSPSVTVPVTTTPVTTAASTTTPVTTVAKTTTAVTAPVTEFTVGGKFIVISPINRYKDAENAYNKTNSIGTYSSGTFYIHKIYNGMLNITRVPGTPGSWINPGVISSTAPVSTTSATTTTPETSTTTPVNSTIPGKYVNYSKNTNNYVTNGYTKIYSEKGSGSSVKEMFIGSIVNVLKSEDGYSYIEHLGSGVVGWVPSRVLTKVSVLSNTVVPKPGTNGIVIGLDSGHGGSSTGAIGYYNGISYKEQDINWQITLKTKSILESMGYTVVMTHDTPTGNPKLYERGLKFNQAGVDYAISIHNNAASNAQKGSLVLSSKLKSNPTAQKNINASYTLGNNISNEFKKLKNGYNTSYNRYDVDFYGDYPLAVMASTDAPSVLVECGFMTNAGDLSYLITSAGQQSFANAIVRGLVNTVNYYK